MFGLVLCATGAIGALRGYRESERAARLQELVATCSDHSLTVENQSDQLRAVTLSNIREGVALLNDDSEMKPVLDGEVKLRLGPRARQELTWPAPEPAFRVAVIATPERTVSAHVAVRDERGEEVTSGSIFCSPR